MYRIVLNQRKRQNYIDRPNHFIKWNEKEFLARFRLSKNVTRYLVNKIVDSISPASNRNHERNHTLSPAEMVLLTLRFYASGCFGQVAGDFSGIDKATVSRVVDKVTIAIARLRNEYIRMPTTEEHITHVRQDFYNIAKFPRCIGAIDCTHIKILSPGGPQAELYRNRKAFFSFNVQVVCNANLEAPNIVCRWPGSAHDSTIFQNSRLRACFEHGDFGDSLIVGDGGYGVKPYLIPPLINVTTEAENLFNESQIQTRNPIERFFGTWKRRFPILAFGIRNHIQKVEQIVVAAAVLHIMCRFMNDPDPPLNVEIEAAVEIVNNANIGMQQPNNNQMNDIVRYTLINEYFQQLL